jgi:hypothetical protein
MAAPLDSVEINTLLDELPQRTQFTQECNTFLHGLEDVVNLFIGGEATDTETDTAVSALVTATQSTENIRRFERGRCAGGARGKSDILESHEKRFTFYVSKGDVDAARVVELGGSVQGGVFHGEETVTQLLGKSSNALGVVLWSQC